MGFGLDFCLIGVWLYSFFNYFSFIVLGIKYKGWICLLVLLFLVLKVILSIWFFFIIFFRIRGFFWVGGFLSFIFLEREVFGWMGGGDFGGYGNVKCSGLKVVEEKVLFDLALSGLG